jgi:SAM-dependent methyltransferase
VAPIRHDASAYGDAIADVYDELHGYLGDVTHEVSVLAELAGAGPALELGVGTGRLALPLAARGIPTHGIDASAKMLARLRAKPGGATISLTLGDFADVDVPGRYSLIYVCFNTLFGLVTPEAQVRCFARAAARLLPGGRFLVEAFVPGRRRSAGISVSAESVSCGRLLSLSRDDPARQRLSTSEVLLGNDGSIRVHPVELRYATHFELDMMACLAGMTLEHRWSSWRRAVFGPESGDHISVYRV